MKAKSFAAIIILSGLSLVASECYACDQNPYANLVASPNYVILGKKVILDGSGSYDPDGGVGNLINGIKTFEWDFDYNGTTFNSCYSESYGAAGDNTFDGKTTYAYSSPGTYIVALRVTDNDEAEGGETDKTDIATFTVNVGADSDGDGLPDGWEVLYGLNPENPSDADTDLDEDSYNNLCEYLHGTDPDDSYSKPDSSLYAVTFCVPDNVNSIQRAIGASIDGDTIVVSEGIYHETIDFKGRHCTLTSTGPTDWNVVAATVIDANDPNSYVITFANSEDVNSILRGFTITGGKLGIHCDGASPAIGNCIISKNGSESGDRLGGGMYSNNSSPSITNCFFIENNANYGGGIYDFNSWPTVVSCVFAKNIADVNGGGMYNYNSSPAMINCTFGGNHANNDGGGIYNYGTSSNPKLTNCIFWGDVAAGDSNEICNSSSADPNFSYCNIKGSGGSSAWDTNLGSNGGGNIDNDPDFINANDPAGLDGVFGTSDDGLRIWVGSQCIDAADGDAEHFPSTDITGWLRVDIDNVDNTGIGDPNYADIGAYEFPRIWFVDKNATGGDGSSWTNAFTNLQDALANANDGDQIWVTGGIYKPTNEPTSFVLVAGVKIYGGFAGTEVALQQRDWKVYNTILSGDIGEPGNSYHVVIGADRAVLDGFIITGGNANGTGADSHGGGLYNSAISTMTIANCVFSGNNSHGSGGGIYNYSSSPTITNCVFTGNISSDGLGGAVYDYSSSPRLINCTFSGNAARVGDGMGNEASSQPAAFNCIFWDTHYEEISNPSLNQTFFSYCDIRGCGGSSGWNSAFGTDGEGNIDVAPDFADANNPAGQDGFLGTLDDGLRLMLDSPCIDASDGSYAPPVDMLGRGRIDVNSVNNTGRGSPIYVDMGAYESGYDSDGDGMPDEWEIRYSLCPTDPFDSYYDFDEDGLANLGEYIIGTNPVDQDTDHDVMEDGWEYYYGLNPTDPNDANTDLDSDGYSNLIEFLHEGDPNDPNASLANITIIVPTVATTTIQQAINLSINGDTIKVLPGTYYESIDFSGKAVTVRSTNPNDWNIVSGTVINANNSSVEAVTFDSSEDSNSILKGFTICKSTYCGIKASSSSPVISNCIIENNGYGICKTEDGTVSPIIVNNIIRDNNDAGIYIVDASLDIKNNLIYNNGAYGIYLSLCQGGLIRNNTIVGHTGCGIKKISGTAAAISNCIVWDNNDDLSGCGATYSCIEDGDSGTGNITVNPNFVNKDANDFHLSLESPCINTGDPNQSYISEVDIDGDVRLRGAYTDMGADEALPVWYVDSDSNGVGTGATWKDAFTSIQDAIDVASSNGGDTIFIAEGTYYESIDFDGKAIILRSTAPEDSNVVAATIIDANDPNVNVVTFASGEDANSSLHGLTVTGGSAGIYCAGNVSPLITRCRIINNEGYGVDCNTASPSILYSTINGNGNYGLRFSLSTAIVANCIIVKNVGGVNGGSPSLTNCDIVDNYGYGAYGCGGVVKNCIIWGNAYFNLNSCSTTYSCIEGFSSGLGNISYMPYFKNVDNDDYHLLSYSPCIDAGDPCSDYSHEPNDPNNLRIDMGAYGNTSEANLASADTDTDELPDAWELLFWPKVDSSSTNDDPDADNLINLEEYHIGLDPNNNDTDADGMPDGWEISNGLDPLNASDGNGDLDGDGLTNVQEYNCGSNPNDCDSDNDYMPDGWEYSNGLDPADSNDANTDLDNDGYSNLEEFLHHGNPDDPNASLPNITLIVPTDLNSIQEAINQSIDGDVVRVLQGRYNESIDFEGKSIVLTSTDPNDWHTIESTIIDAGDANQVVLFQSGEDVNSILTGFTLTNGGYGILCKDSSGPAVIRCIIEYNSSHGIYCLSGSVAILNNMIGQNSGNGVYSASSAPPSIKNNWIFKNNNGIGFDSAGSAAVVRNNTIIGSTGHGIYVFSGTAPIISNCIIWNNNDELESCTATYSCIRNIIDANGTGNIIDSPQFIDDPNIDCRLMRSSPCINAGDPNGTYTNEKDIEGETREAGNIDMGADEVCEVHNLNKDVWYHYVDNEGIQDAIDDANENDVVVVYEWKFNEILNFNGKNIKLTSTDPNNWKVVECTVIDADDPNLDVVTFSSGEDANAIITGFAISGGKYGIKCDNLSSPVIMNCIITDNNSNGVYCVSGRPLITNNKIADNVGSGICSASSSPPTIKSNWIYKNENGIVFSSASLAATIRNNTITDNNDVGIYVASGSKPNISNCVLWGNSEDLSGCSATYSCIMDINDANGVGNVTSNPLFLAPDTNDYHLTSLSPCIGIGDISGVSLSEKDIDKQSILLLSSDNGFATDIGADTLQVLYVTGQRNPPHTSFMFDDTQHDYVDLPSTFSVGNNFTVAMWINPETIGDQIQALISKWSSGDGDIFVVGLSRNGYYVNLRGHTFQIGTPTTGWQHIAVVVSKIADQNKSFVSFYQNGSWSWFETLDDVMGSPPQDKAWTIGDKWSSTGRGNYFKGNIDDVKIFNAALLEPDIRNLYEEVYSNSTSLIGYWQMNDNDASSKIVVDSSDKNNNGTSYRYTLLMHREPDHTTPWGITYENLQDAIDAETSAEIWVKQGTYKPTNPTGRDATFQLKTNVQIYGGFNGNELTRKDRNWEEHQTILSGNIGYPWMYYDNCYHVVTGANNAILDGFIIQDGRADGSNGFAYGGGMYNDMCPPKVENVIFKNNYANGGGAGITNMGASSNVTLLGCTFLGNGNTAVGYGGAVANWWSSPRIVNSVFSENQSKRGGGVYNYSYASNPKITNCLFSINNANQWGGGMYNYCSTPEVANCTFIDNTGSVGKAAYNFGSYAAFSNSIMWGASIGQIFDNQSYPTVTFCDIKQEGVYSGTGNINADPKLICDGSWWKFDEGSGNLAEDFTGNNDGTVYGASWTTSGKFGDALSFDGSDDYVEVANESNFDITKCITVSAWIKVTGFNKNCQAIITKGDNAWRLNRYSNTDYIQFFCGCDGDKFVNGNTNVNNGQWHFVAGVYDGTKIYLYIDNYQPVSQTASGKMATNNCKVNIGRQEDISGRNFWGSIDEVKIFRRALSAFEIQQLYESNKAKYNYVLAKDSPCIEVGSNAAVPNDELDLDQDRRTNEPIPYDLAGKDRIVYSGNIYSINTRLLLHLNGADGEHEVTEDSSWREHSVEFSEAELDTDQKVFGTTSCYFPSYDSCLSITDSDDFSFGNFDFTVDFRIRWSDDGDDISDRIMGTAGGGLEWSIDYNISQSGKLTFHLQNPAGTAHNVSWSWGPAKGVWYHVAITRCGNIWRLFVNGTQTGGDQLNDYSVPNVPAPLEIGRVGGTGSPSYWLDEIRIVKGVALWTGNFTPPRYEYFTAGVDMGAVEFNRHISLSPDSFEKTDKTLPPGTWTTENLKIYNTSDALVNFTIQLKNGVIECQ